jgi:hypothetical protein
MTDTEATAIPENSIGKSDLETLRENASLRLTDKVRALALGVVAFSWALISADKPPVSNIDQSHHVWVLLTALAAVVSLLFDLLQSLGNYVEFNRLRKRLEQPGERYAQFNPKSVLYRSQNGAFALKIALCVCSCLSLICLVGASFL